MSGTIALVFPVLDEEGAGFVDGVSYTVSATIQGLSSPRMLTVEHRLTGASFVRDWVQFGDARISTRLLFRNGARREAHPFDGDFDDSGEALVAAQRIRVSFLQNPEVACSIVAVRDRKLVVCHRVSGLTGFWRAGDRIDIPRYARIGRHAALTFDDDSLGSLIHVVEEKEMGSGQMKADVKAQAPEGEKPVTLLCARDVYDKLQAFTEAPPASGREAMRSAIVTQALCAIYGHMNMLARIEDENYNEEDINSTLRSHGERLKAETGLAWDDDDFNPSLAATKMRPYAILKNGYVDDGD